MTTILAIESSASLCSLALQVGDKIFSREATGQRTHTANMLPFVEALLDEAALKVADLDAIAFSAGPGSFTGIRLAASIAKSLAYAADKPVIPVSSLAVIAQGFFRLHSEGHSESQRLDEVAVVTDARMNEVYCGEYRLQGPTVLPVGEDRLIKLAAIDDMSIKAETIVGDAEALLAQRSNFDKKHYVNGQAYALDILPLAAKAFVEKRWVSAMAAEAIYLRGKSGWKTTKEQLADKAKKL